VSIAVGTNLGVVAGTSDAFQRPIKRGTALAPFHSAVEVGYALTPNLEIAVQGRFQVEPGFTAGAEPRLRWLPIAEGTVRPYAQVGIPILRLRHNVDLRPVVDADDTVTAGFVGIGAGGGVSFQLSKIVGLGVEIHTLTIFPDTTFAVDAQVRVRLRF
jgi:hypothetical protein